MSDIHLEEIEDEDDSGNCIQCGGVESDQRCFWCFGETECVPLCPCVTGENYPVPVFYPESALEEYRLQHELKKED